ncbi:hypothetical protein UFOVP117_37 [uncultured Caudovirales phage]|uniref:Uncharacterized protein n=1 Tax=uncultured Caudovirales phage TaxID=2100421 RepID=A0A6J5L6C4_9CAUD|nr:hypothetical protein UFOVP117_37 [uncultured Caudovirales phage]
MSESTLDYSNSEFFRNRLVTRNLQPYNVEGAFQSSNSEPYYETNISDNSVIDSPNVNNEIFTEAQQNIIPNQYGPTGGFQDASGFISKTTGQVNENSSNQLEYWPLQNDTNMDLINEQWINLAEVSNRFIPNGGYEGLFFADTKILSKNNGTSDYNPLNLPFVVGNYSLADIIFGSDNLVQQDSYLLQISVLELRKAFQYRIAQELRQTSVSNNLSINSNPLQSTLLATNQAQLSYLDYHITVPDGVGDSVVYLTQRITGTYLPYSPIEGDYFNFSPRQPKTGVGRFVQRLSNNDGSASVKFLANTGGGQKSILFANLEYNRYSPNYDRNITRAGQVLNNLFGNIGKNEQDNSGNLYVGGKDELKYVTSPAGETPYNGYGEPTGAVVLGPDAVGKLYEGDQNLKFGLNDNNTVVGGFVWTKTGSEEIGIKFGPEGEQFGTDNSNNTAINLTNRYSSSLEYDFKRGSILDNTQRLIDSAPSSGLARRLHAGNAINQTSKVFNDGYKELTKGSKVIRYQNVEGKLIGKEYGRLFTKDKPYQQYQDLQSTVANTSGGETNGNIRRFNNSVLDSTYNLNIAPWKGEGSTNIVNGQVKKYMFSIENLAWKGSSMFNDLPGCEKGPNGGRIMWFPPYDLTFSETVSPGFDTTSFLGRPEPIYTYKDTSRSGSISFSIIVDHPSVLNLIAKKELQNDLTDKKDSVIESFFAGAAKFDLYELARKFATLDIQTLKELQESVLSSNQTSAEQSASVSQDLKVVNSIANNLPNFSEYNGFGGYFPQWDSTIKTTDYETVYNGYISQQSVYESNPDKDRVSNQFPVITYNYNKLVELRGKILEAVTSQNCEIVIEMNGLRFQPSDSTNSINRNKDYIESIKLFFSNFTDSNNKKLSSFIQDGTVKFIDSNLLLTTAEVKGNGVSTPVNCSIILTGWTQNYSLEAMCSRYVSIKNITVNSKNPSNVNAGSSTNSQNIANQNANNGLPIPSSTALDKKNLSKRLLRTKLLNECDYFEVLKQTDPFAYTSISDKVKYFQPAFHAITPEGLNSRLTFLQQCTRPGNTIPVINEQGQQDTSTSTFNTNFGTPPVLVLRIGDFYNTKAIPDTLQISYENLDINPEGIGLQPMIAKVTLGVKLIGGSGLKGPIDRLQNALSFNFYANTEMYDERADATEDTSALDDALFNSIVLAEPLATINDLQNIPETNKTIGDILTTVASGLTQTGTIQYKSFFDNYITQTQGYFSTTLDFIGSSISNYNFGIYSQMTFDRNFRNGTVKLSGLTQQTNIYGKPSRISENLTEVANQLKSDIDDETETIIKALNNENGITNLAVNRVKDNYKNLINSKINNAFNNVNSDSQDFANKQSQYIQNIEKLNSIVGGQLDGKILANGVPKGYLISIDSTFSNDYSLVCSGITNFYNLLSTKQFLPSTGAPYCDFVSLFVDGSNPLNPNSDNLLFTLFYDDLKDNTKRQQFISGLTTNLIPGTSGSVISIVTQETNNLSSTFDNWNTQILKNFNEFKTSPEVNQYLNYNPQINGASIKGKDRIYNYNTSGVTDTQLNSLRSLFSPVNSNNFNLIFNGKKQFN